MAIRDPKQPTVSQVKINFSFYQKYSIKSTPKISISLCRPVFIVEQSNRRVPASIDYQSIPHPLFHEGCRQAALSFL